MCFPKFKVIHPVIVERFTKKHKGQPHDGTSGEKHTLSGTIGVSTTFDKNPSNSCAVSVWIKVGTKLTNIAKPGATYSNHLELYLNFWVSCSSII